MDSRLSVPDRQPSGPAYFDKAVITGSLTVRATIDSMKSLLASGFDPESGAPRTRVETRNGTFMQMPATSGDYVGTKLLTITPGNASTKSPVIQGIYALFGGEEQRPLAVFDGVALTNLRTSSVSAMGAALLTSPGPKRLVIFGTGVQAWAHIVAFAEVFELASVEIVGRNQDAASEMARDAQRIGLNATSTGPDAATNADLVVCTTSSTTPLFDGALVKPSAVVVAIGSHDSDHRELDDALLSRATICVESRDSATREAGEVIQGLESGAIADATQLVTVADLVIGRATVPLGRPAVFKTTGMPWEDLAVAIAIYEASSSKPT